MKPRVLVAGVRASGEGYPNASHTMRILREQSVAEVVDLGQRFPDDVQLWKLSSQPRTRQAVWIVRVLSATISSFARLLRVARNREDWVYVPYPAIPMMLLLALLPRRIRPRCIVDAYISVWDSAYGDRRRSGRFLERVVRLLESVSLRAAHVALVDTEANRLHLSQALGLEFERVKSCPLAIEWDLFRKLKSQPRTNGKVRVTFIGTLIPLHGVPVILEAARLLRYDDRIEFVFIGDGQLGEDVAKILSEERIVNLVWQRKWQSLGKLAQEIANSDICLGVFGGEAKASRVLPFKIYYALAVGRPVITQRALSTPSAVPPPPVRGVDVSGDVGRSARNLASEIRWLARSQSVRQELGASSRQYFDQFLADSAVAERWRGGLASEWAE